MTLDWLAGGLAQPSTENTRERERKLLLLLQAYSAQARLKVLKLQAEVDEESRHHQEHQVGSEIGNIFTRELRYQPSGKLEIGA